jgi:hypothetical protein
MRKLIVFGSAFFVAAACFAEAPARKEAPARQQWEYQAVGRKKVEELGKNDLTAGLNKLGDDGWELVAVSPPTEYYFKRPKTPATREEPRRAAAAPEGAGDELFVMRLKFTPAPELVKTLQPLFPGKSPVITSDARTNTLLLRGSPKQIEEVQLLVRALDIPDAEDGGGRKKGAP